MKAIAPNKAPATNRRLRFPFDGPGAVACLFYAPPASPAAVGETRCSPVYDARVSSLRLSHYRRGFLRFV
jgi:hypothetical protein